jgi:hypothetical protein
MLPKSLLAAGFVVLFAPAAQAGSLAVNTGSEGAVGQIQSANGTFKGQLLSGDTHVWASPLGVGASATGSLASGTVQGNLGPLGECSATGSVLQGSVNASIGLPSNSPADSNGSSSNISNNYTGVSGQAGGAVGSDLTRTGSGPLGVGGKLQQPGFVNSFNQNAQLGPVLGTDGNGASHRTNGQFASGAEAASAKKKATADLGCNVSASVNLVSATASCQTAVGTFGVGGTGPGADAGCGCTGCSAAVYWASAAASYQTPTATFCGLTGSVGVNAGVLAGVGAGVKGSTQGVGGTLTLGPLQLGGDVAIDKFDPAGAANCAVNAVKAVAAVGEKIGQGAVKTFNTVTNAIGNGAGKVADAAGDAWHTATSWVPCFWSCSSKASAPPAPSEVPGNNVSRNTPTTAGAVAVAASASQPTGHGVVRNANSNGAAN